MPSRTHIAVHVASWFALLAAACPAAAKAGTGAQLIQRLNLERARVGLDPLKANRRLSGAARRQSRRQLKNDRFEHASNLGAMIAAALARLAGCEAYIVDPVSVDEWEPVARLSGLHGLDRQALSHALNTKAIARRHAQERGTPYRALRLVVIHLGSGTTVSAHRDGRMVDASNAREEGPLSMERAGGVPAMKLAELATRPGMTLGELERMLFREGGAQR